MSASASASSAVPVLAEPMAFLRAWTGGLNEGHVERVLALYDATAVLVPTFADRLLTTPAGVRGYFEQLAAREDLGVALHEDSVQVQTFGPGLHAVSGIYDWHFGRGTERRDFAARFSYVLDLNRASPILHHQSSQVPPAL